MGCLVKRLYESELKRCNFYSTLGTLKVGKYSWYTGSGKKKIKSLRDTYRKELHKVQKSKKSGAGADEVYKPKLMWYSAAEVFWHGAVCGRESSSNLVST